MEKREIKQREIKFRCWNPDQERMIESPFLFQETQEHDNENTPFTYYEEWIDWEDGVKRPCYVMQFTGQRDADNKEVWEGDIGRITEEQDFGDNNIYLICIWIKEWSMFGWIEHNELTAYESKGVEALDEFMFWTYNLEDAGVTVCGNIYQHPDYIQKAQQEEEKTMNEGFKSTDLNK